MVFELVQRPEIEEISCVWVTRYVQKEEWKGVLLFTVHRITKSISYDIVSKIVSDICLFQT
jgi:hypothetical protein